MRQLRTKALLLALPFILAFAFMPSALFMCAIGMTAQPVSLATVISESYRGLTSFARFIETS